MNTYSPSISSCVMSGWVDQKHESSGKEWEIVCASFDIIVMDREHSRREEYNACTNSNSSKILCRTGASSTATSDPKRFLSFIVSIRYRISLCFKLRFGIIIHLYICIYLRFEHPRPQTACDVPIEGIS